MMQRYALSLLAVMLPAGFAVAGSYNVSDGNFATRVVSYSGPFGPLLYNDPCAVLGKPTTWMIGEGSQIFACSLVYPSWNVDPNHNNVVLQLINGANIVVGFNHNVGHDPGNPYRIDFIVFGRDMFSGQGTIYDNTNMDNYFLTSPVNCGGSNRLVVSVAQEDPNDPNQPDTWYTFNNGPYVNDPNGFPTNAFAWDSNSATWGTEQNWLRPVDPNLTIASFAGKSAAQAIAMYGSSAGGTGFDLSKLAPSDYAALRADSRTGLKYIKYIKVTASLDYSGTIDGFADVMPYPPGDLNQDYRVDMKDFAIAAQQWPKLTLVLQVVDNWLKCTWNCP